MKKLWIPILTMYLCLANTSFCLAQDIGIDEIVKKANLAAYYAGQDGSSDVKMTITDSQGRQRTREFRILRLNLEAGGKQKFYVYFQKPADVAKMVFMVWKNVGADDDRWLYMPALDLVRRIAASDKRSSFVGSHFVYEDVSGRGINEDTHELVETTADTYKLKNTPKDPKGTEFAYYFIWIQKSNFLPIKAEYYDNLGKMIRSIEALEIKDVEGYPTVIRSLAKDIQRGGETKMEFSNSHYNIGLTEDIFEERYLRMAPAKWIK